MSAGAQPAVVSGEKVSSPPQALRQCKSVDELRHAAVKYRPAAIVLDLESASLSEVEVLKKEFEGVRVICNHRVADEEMWTRTLNVGADDCWPSSDMREILSSAVRDNQLSRQMVV